MIRSLFLLLGLCFALAPAATAQPDRWQQRADYTMAASLDVTTHRFTGTQTIRYTNNSPDTLRQLYYHLYFNAFRVGSAMDWRNRTLPDPDGRVGLRISKLQPNEEGELTCKTLTVNGQPVRFAHNGTILEVELAQPILPGAVAVLDMAFEGQVPIQIRRSGRDNAEGIAYSMAQWYPKLCQYDYQGWHPNPYIGREFYGIWGDWDVKLTLDSRYVVAATGYLQNPQEIGHGYEAPGTPVNRPAGDKLTWHFKAPRVHDFVWAADPDYRHTQITYADTLQVHFFFQPEADKDGTWTELMPRTLRMFDFLNTAVGPYPYRAYSFIQGGDGGMEYPMATLINGNGRKEGVWGTAFHELAHSWFQMVLATNEALYAWMDEGFDSYITATGREFLATGTPAKDSLYIGTFAGTYRGYISLVQSGREEALSTHADHFETNGAYGFAAYGKGAIYLHQLGYVIGKDALARGLRRYYRTWQFKHPNPNDLLRIFEAESGLELDWYNEYFVYTTKTVDYAVAKVAEGTAGATAVTLERKGFMPMPIDLVVTYTDGSRQLFYIPLDLMRGEKPNDQPAIPRTVLADWTWSADSYTLTLPRPLTEVAKLEIDGTQRLADVVPANNLWEKK
ncbi:MAG: M1 family metallopeptidase [Bacteroidia bacterium]|nr:M1 family metallopeptidase [Bacteroidia bacterium]